MDTGDARVLTLPGYAGPAWGGRRFSRCRKSQLAVKRMTAPGHNFFTGIAGVVPLLNMWLRPGFWDGSAFRSDLKRM
jgi:hypothetical protein